MNAMRKTMRALFAGSLVAGALTASPALAAPVVYAATLDPGVTVIGDANHAVGGAFSAPDLWTFYTFNATANEMLDVVVRRTSGALDPFFAVWFGEELDTSAFFDMVSSSASTSWLGFADDELPPLFAGSGGDAALSFLTPGTGAYVIAVAGFSGTADDLPQSFAITLEPEAQVSRVPEPGTSMLFALAFGALALARRRAS